MKYFRSCLSCLALSGTLLGPIVSDARAEETLIFATINAPQNPLSAEVFHPWADRINEQAKGLLRIDVRDGYALAKFDNVYDRVTTNVIQVGWALQSAVGGKFQLSEVAALPFAPGNCEQNSDALWRVYKSGELDVEYRDIIPLMLAALPQVGVHLRVAPAAGPDLNGLKLLTFSKTLSESASRLGGVPISLPLTAMYEGLQRGTVDGTLVSWNAFRGFKIGEVTSYHIDAHLGGSVGMVFMARKKFDTLSPEIQKLLIANSGEAQSRAFGRFWDNDRDRERANIATLKDHTIVQLTPTQEADWRKRVGAVVEAWVEANPAGRQVLAAYRKELDGVIAEK